MGKIQSSESGGKHHDKDLYTRIYSFIIFNKLASPHFPGIFRYRNISTGWRNSSHSGIFQFVDQSHNASRDYFYCINIVSSSTNRLLVDRSGKVGKDRPYFEYTFLSNCVTDGIRISNAKPGCKPTNKLFSLLPYYSYAITFIMGMG